MSIWAQIYGGTVVNLVNAPADGNILDQSFGWCDITNYNPQPQIGWTTSDNINFVNPAPAITLPQAIQRNLQEFQAAVEDFVDNSYSLEIRFNFMALYVLATQAGLTNRAAYISQLFTWAQAVVSYSASYAGAINAMTDIAQVTTTKWDFTKISIPNPHVSPMVAIQIVN
jgi:hypothetical protein